MQHAVIMFELARKGEELTPMGQVNEVFGPFDDGEAAEAWSKRAVDIIKDRHWVVIPLSNPSVLNSLDPQMG